MINLEDLTRLKELTLRYSDEPHSFVCHPDTKEAVLQEISKLCGQTLINAKVLGLPILTFPFIPKDRIYVLTQDVVRQIKEAIREMAE